MTGQGSMELGDDAQLGEMAGELGGDLGGEMATVRYRRNSRMLSSVTY